VDVIRVHAPSEAHARRLLAAVDGNCAAEMVPAGPAAVLELTLDREAAKGLIDLFDALGRWLSDGDLTACRVGFGERSYTLLAVPDGKRNDPSAFLLERTLQLQTALDSRVVIEQAKGVLVAREGIDPDEAFKRLRRAARSKRIKIHDLAGEVVNSARARSKQKA
jgi:ANTAR domain-containing protein